MRIAGFLSTGSLGAWCGASFVEDPVQEVKLESFSIYVLDWTGWG